MVMLVSTKGTVPVLVRVTVCGALVVLIGTSPNGREAVESVATGLTVVPVRVTVPVTAGAATATLTKADRLVLLLGVNVTEIVQLPPAAKPAPLIGQFWVIPNRNGLAPASVIPVMRRTAPPVLVTVMVCAIVRDTRG